MRQEAKLSLVLRSASQSPRSECNDLILGMHVGIHTCMYMYVCMYALRKRHACQELQAQLRKESSSENQQQDVEENSWT